MTKGRKEGTPGISPLPADNPLSRAAELCLVDLTALYLKEGKIKLAVSIYKSVYFVHTSEFPDLLQQSYWSWPHGACMPSLPCVATAEQQLPGWARHMHSRWPHATSNPILFDLAHYLSGLWRQMSVSSPGEVLSGISKCANLLIDSPVLS